MSTPVLAQQPPGPNNTFGIFGWNGTSTCYLGALSNCYINVNIVGGGTGGGAVTAIAAAFVDGWSVTDGSTTDTACATDNGTCGIVALIKRNNQRLTTLNSTLGTPLQAGGTVVAVPTYYANYTPAQVSVASTATLIAASRASRSTLTICDPSTTPVFLGGSGVTTSTGEAPGWTTGSASIAGACRSFVNFTGAVYGIVTTGTVTVTESETY